VRLRAEAAGERDLGEARAPLAQQPRGALDPPTHDVAVRRLAGRGLERAREVKRAQMCFTRERDELEALIEVRLDVVEHAAQAPRRERPRRAATTLEEQAAPADADGTRRELAASDAFVIPKGWAATWDMRTHFRKIFVNF
jgi:hypothetical protein